MNFAQLTSFQAIEFMDWPVPKTLDISVCQTSNALVTGNPPPPHPGETWGIRGDLQVLR